MYEFDRTDIRIVNLLITDGRMSASQISRRLRDASERAVRYRIGRMIEERAIQIGAVARPQAFGFTTIADVWMEVESDKIVEVSHRMAEFDEVTYVACAIGQTDVSIQVVARDTAEIYHFVTEVVRKVPGVRKTTTTIVPIIVKDVYQWRVPSTVGRTSPKRKPRTKKR